MPGRSPRRLHRLAALAMRWSNWLRWIDIAVTFKANLLPGAMAAFCLEADREPQRPALHAHAGERHRLWHWTGRLDKRAIRQHANGMANARRPRAGERHRAMLPERLEVELSVWGPPRNDAWLMREVKAKFDPKGIFNPGAFVDGI